MHCLWVQAECIFFGWEQALQLTQWSHWCGWNVFCSCRTSSLQNTLRQSLHDSRSSAEREHCLSGNYFNFLNTVTLIFSQNFYHNSVLTCKKNRPYFARHLKHKYYCHKPAHWILLYRKRPRFSDINFKIFESQKPLGKFCSEMQNLFQRTTNEINRIINSDSYNDPCFGITFWDTVWINAVTLHQARSLWQQRLNHLGTY